MSGHVLDVKGTLYLETPMVPIRKSASENNVEYTHVTYVSDDREVSDLRWVSESRRTAETEEGSEKKIL